MTTPMHFNPVPDIEQTVKVSGHSSAVVIGEKDSAGALWWWDDLEGWFGTPGMDLPITPLGVADRAIAASRFPRKERYITIRGVCQVETPEDLWEARSRLTAGWDRPNADEEFDLIVYEPTPKQIRVRTSGPITMPWSESMYSFSFEIPLVALVPFKRALTPEILQTTPSSPGEYGRTYPYTYPYTYTSGIGSSAGTVTFHNEGSANSYPVVSVTGPLSPGWQVLNETTGKWASVSLAVGSNQTLEMDFEKQRVTVGGVVVTDARHRGEWFPLVPGENILRFSSPLESPDAAMTVTAYSMWK